MLVLTGKQPFYRLQAYTPFLQVILVLCCPFYGAVGVVLSRGARRSRAAISTTVGATIKL